jgi:hypothetical protein
MRLSCLTQIALLISLQLVGAIHTFACQCGGERPTKNLWERAEQREQRAAVVFEGVPTHFEMRLDALNAEDGKLISADIPGPALTEASGLMLVTFQVNRVYKGNLGTEVQLITGLGGGDCGARYAVGILYLIYADRSNGGELTVSMCSVGGWIGDSRLAGDLRYLRKEKPIPADRLRFETRTEQNSGNMEEERKRLGEKYDKAFAAVTGKICGSVKSRETIEKYALKVSFLSVAGYSPIGHPWINVNQDGSFCSGPLGPGKYDVFLSGGFGWGSTPAAYYPGVPQRKQAREVEVAASQTVSDIVFEIPEQKTFSVRGFISVPKNARPGKVELLLIGLDGAPSDVWRRQTIALEGWTMIGGVKYFSIDNVLPGRYVPILTTDLLNVGWSMPKQEVDVTNHSKLISLKLVQK